MARGLRFQDKDWVYHIFSKGNRGEFIFDDPARKRRFLRQLDKGVQRYGIELFAYCLMNNHYHLLAAAPGLNLDRFMHYLGSAYGSYLRSEHGVIGHIFAGRYKSIPVENDTHFANLLRYIHLNPVDAGIVALPHLYPWSSYRHIIGMEFQYPWINREEILRGFINPSIGRIREFRAFVEDAIGTAAYLEEAAAFDRTVQSAESFKEVPLQLVECQDLLNAVCSSYSLTDLRPEGARAVGPLRTARAVFVFLAKEMTGASNSEIAEMAGGISASGILHQYKRVTGWLAAEDERSDALLAQIAEIKSIMGTDPSDLSVAIPARAAGCR
jgi:REP element-mobilizing transposase RayT